MPRGSRLIPIGFLLLAALVPLLVYLPTARYGLLLDDWVLFQKSPSLTDLHSIPRAFLLDVGGLRKGADRVISSYYRPAFLALSTVYARVAGGQPSDWHLAAVVLAALAGVLAYGFLSRLGFPRLPALLASLVFSLHPAHVSSVAWVSGLQELLAACFSLCSLLALLWREEEERDLLPLGLAALSFALALLSKEVGLALLPFVAIWALQTAKSSPRRSRRLRRATGAFAGIAILYLAARVAVLGGLAHPPPGAPGLARSLPSVPVALATYLRLLVWPTGFAIFRPERPTFGPLDGTVLLSVAALLALGLLAGWTVRRRRDLLLPIAWLVVWLLPVLNLWALDPQLMVSDRYLFLPSLALPWLVLLLLPRRASLAVLAVLALVFAGLTLRYSAIFRNERTFLAAMEKAEPTSPIVFAEKGRLLARDGAVTEARVALARAVDLDPLAAGALLNLGDLELLQGELDAAEAHYRKALEVRPYASRPFKHLTIALAQAGRRDEALALAEESARRWPEDFEVQLLDALLLGAAGQREKAEAAFGAARRLRPQEPAIQGGLDAALARLLPTVLPRGG
jgi:protein O-mannosyl-transferase